MCENAWRGAPPIETGPLGNFSIFCLLNYSSFTDGTDFFTFEVINLALDTRSIFLGP